MRYLTASRIILASSFFLPSSFAADRTSLIRLDKSPISGKEHRAASPAHSEPRNLRILDAIEPEPLLHREIDYQSTDTLKPSTTAPKIMPQQGVDPQSDIVGDGGTSVFVQPGVLNSSPDAELGDTTASLPHHMEDRQLDVLNSISFLNPNTPGLAIKPQRDGGSTASVQPDTLNSNPVAENFLFWLESRPLDNVSVPNVAGAKSRPHQMTYQHLGFGNSGANGAQVVAPSCYFSSSSGLLVIFRPYTHPNRMLIFLSSTVVALIAIVIQYELGPEMPHNGTVLIRPGWSRHRSEGWS